LFDQGAIVWSRDRIHRGFFVRRKTNEKMALLHAEETRRSNPVFDEWPARLHNLHDLFPGFGVVFNWRIVFLFRFISLLRAWLDPSTALRFARNGRRFVRRV